MTGDALDVSQVWWKVLTASPSESHAHIDPKKSKNRNCGISREQRGGTTIYTHPIWHDENTVTMQ